MLEHEYDVQNPFTVMAGLVPAIHGLSANEHVDARHKAGHDALIVRRLDVTRRAR